MLYSIGAFLWPVLLSLEMSELNSARVKSTLKLASFRVAFKPRTSHHAAETITAAAAAPEAVAVTLTAGPHLTRLLSHLVNSRLAWLLYGSSGGVQHDGELASNKALAYWTELINLSITWRPHCQHCGYCGGVHNLSPFPTTVCLIHVLWRHMCMQVITSGQ